MLDQDRIGRWRRTAALVLALAVLLLAGPWAVADAPGAGTSPPAPATDKLETAQLWDFIWTGIGGSVVSLAVALTIVMFSVIALGVFFDRVFFLRRFRDLDGFLDQLFHKMETEDLAACIKYCEDTDAPYADLYRHGLNFYRVISQMTFQRMSDIERAMEKGLIEVSHRIERNISWLGIVAHTGPLLGLFGSVWGMMVSFTVLAATATPTTKDLAHGIATSLVATAGGLVVAIPSFVAYQYFNNRASVIIDILQKSILEFINRLKFTRT